MQNTPVVANEEKKGSIHNFYEEEEEENQWEDQYGEDTDFRDEEVKKPSEKIREVVNQSQNDRVEKVAQQEEEKVLVQKSVEKVVVPLE